MNKRASAPAQKDYPFAPGVIQGPDEYGKPLSRGEALGCWLVLLASLVIFMTLVGFSGYFTLKGLLS